MPQQASLKYLNSASQSLAIASPAVSAHLGLVHSSLTEKAGEGVLRLAAQNCTACGAVLSPGLTCEIVRENRTRKVRIAQAMSNVKTSKLRCSVCNAVTTTESAKPSRGQINRKESPITDIQSKGTTTVEPSTKSDLLERLSKASRRRTKNKKSTLQSMLETQKLQPSPEAKGLGLDLMDLVKQ